MESTGLLGASGFLYAHGEEERGSERQPSGRRLGLVSLMQFRLQSDHRYEVVGSVENYLVVLH